ncbi:MAG: hypothetical protein JXK94_14560 [Deltaproteobacteria bacterium]|nr:hypothetical protein [Deltaproteobacteria bacterium]
MFLEKFRFSGGEHLFLGAIHVPTKKLIKSVVYTVFGVGHSVPLGQNAPVCWFAGVFLMRAIRAEFSASGFGVASPDDAFFLFTSKRKKQRKGRPGDLPFGFPPLQYYFKDGQKLAKNAQTVCPSNFKIALPLRLHCKGGKA